MHSTIRVFATAFVCLALSGCEKPEVKACEAFIKDNVQLPSSYKRIEISSHDEGPMSRAEFYASVGIPDPAHDESPTIRTNALLYGNSISRRVLYVKYEADGAQAIERCVFKIRDGKLADEDRLDQVVSSASLDVNSEQLKDAGLLPDDGHRSKIGSTCCVSPIG